MNTIKFIVVVSIALLSFNLIYHQVVNGLNASNRVDNLIEDTKRQDAQEKQYRTELIKRMQNTTCLPQTIISKGEIYPFNPYSFTTSELELKLEDCVKREIIK